MNKKDNIPVPCASRNRKYGKENKGGEMDGR